MPLLRRRPNQAAAASVSRPPTSRSGSTPDLAALTSVVEDEAAQAPAPALPPRSPSAPAPSTPLAPSPAAAESSAVPSSSSSSSRPDCRRTFTPPSRPAPFPPNNDGSHASVPSSPPLPTSPPRDSRSSQSSSHAATLSILTSTASRPGSPPIPDDSSRHWRLSTMRFRNKSESHLANLAKRHAAAAATAAATAPPLPPPPSIITTAPTVDFEKLRKRPSRLNLAARFRKSSDMANMERQLMEGPADAEFPRLDGRGSVSDRPKSRLFLGSQALRQSIAFHDPMRHSTFHAPPAYGDDNASTLALPADRLSESSRSDVSLGDRVYGSNTTTTTTTQTVTTTKTTTTFFRLPHRKPKQPEPLFPIAHLQRHATHGALAGDTGASTASLAPPAGPSHTPTAASRRRMSESVDGSPLKSRSSLHATPGLSPRNDPATPPTSALALFGRSNGSPATALFRPSSRNSAYSSPTRSHLNIRNRSSTLGSTTGRNSPRPSVDEHLVPQQQQQQQQLGRTSMSSSSRKSFGDLLGLSRLRQGSEPAGRKGNHTPATPGSETSKTNSLQIQRDSIILPERRDDDTPSKYLERLLEVISRNVIAALLCKGTDAFADSVLRSYMRTFKFFEDPMDMAIRKLLMEAELPKETQQIDRCLQAFANRYHECNPGIFTTPDQAYFIAFSLLILHTDVFNKNNKQKMQKADYLKNTRGEGIFDEVLEVFYDNITYTPFIHVEDDLDINGERIIAHKAKRKSIFPNAAIDPAKKVAKEPIDPYLLIIDHRLDILRPNLKEVMHLEDHYSYLGTAKRLNLKELQKTFFKTGVLQIVSARSRPDAFMSEKTATNPEEAHPGIVDIKITKVGLLWRKDAKKKKTRSPWQEWGAILTGAQLYFFRNTQWIKGLMAQYEEHVKTGRDGDSCIFKPPLEHFKPDALMSTDGAVALLDTAYRKHKHAFVYVRHGGLEEVLLAEDNYDRNDWLAKLNFAAAFRTAGVRMRGVIGGYHDGQMRRAIRQLDVEGEQPAIANRTGDVSVPRSHHIDQNMAHDILAARRDIMIQKIANAGERLEQSERNLESQLRNSRHLQILAPIQPKTREAILLSAAKMAAKLKWTRMEIWRLKCHRDILLMDLEEERQILGLPQDASYTGAKHPPRGEAPVTVHAVPRTESRDSTYGVAPPASPRSSPPIDVSLTRSSTVTGRSDPDSSPLTDVFQTPPTSATSASFQRQQQSPWELPSLPTDRSDRSDPRKASVSSGQSAVMMTPPSGKPGSSGSAAAAAAAENPRPLDQRHVAEEVMDVDERGLLVEAGLLEPMNSSGLPHGPTTPFGSEELSVVANPSTDTPSASSKLDRGKAFRRSLQRTLRESAGPFSSHRASRRGRDRDSSYVSSTSGGGASRVSEEMDGGDANGTAPEVLARGTGSFVVHGKKASVIEFGNELQRFSPEDGMRTRRLSQVQQPNQQQQSQQRQHHLPPFDEASSPSSPLQSDHPSTSDVFPSNETPTTARRDSAVFDAAAPEASDGPSDFRSVLNAHQQEAASAATVPTSSSSSVIYVGGREHRGSGASASTTTARSFRELHRKYSIAQAAHQTQAQMHAANNRASRSNNSLPASFGGGLGLVVPAAGDEDSDAAVSFVSDGRHTPLPPIEGEEDEEDGAGCSGTRKPRSSRTAADGSSLRTSSVPPASRHGRPGGVAGLWASRSHSSSQGPGFSMHDRTATPPPATGGESHSRRGSSAVASTTEGGEDAVTGAAAVKTSTRDGADGSSGGASGGVGMSKSLPQAPNIHA